MRSEDCTFIYSPIARPILLYMVAMNGGQYKQDTNRPMDRVPEWPTSNRRGHEVHSTGFFVYPGGCLVVDVVVSGRADDPGKTRRPRQCEIGK